MNRSVVAGFGRLLRPYHASAKSQSTQRQTHVVDLRSDVLTQPTPEMRRIISEAQLGDDVFEECTVTNALQDKVARLFGMEAALFVPSGTMANLLAVLTYCPRRGTEVLLGSMSHLFLYEQGGISGLGGLHPHIIPNLRDGTFPVTEIDERVRMKGDAHYPETGLICVENTQQECGGKVLPLQWLKQLKDKASEHNLPVHMDGARVMNAVVALNVKPSDVLQHVDSVSMCFSKGLGAPVGSVLAGTSELIAGARRLRKALGGGWRQPGLLAAAAIYGLDHAEETMRKDHQHAQILAQALHEHGDGVISIDPKDVHANTLVVTTTKPGLSTKQLCERLVQIPIEEERQLRKAVQVRSLPFGPNRLRLVLNWNISPEDVQAAVNKFEFVLDETRQP